MNSKYGCWQCGQPVCECERISKELDATPSPSNRAQRTAEIEWGRRAWLAQNGTPANSIAAIRMALTQLDAEARATGKSREAVLADWSASRLDAPRVAAAKAALSASEVEARRAAVAANRAEISASEAAALRAAVWASEAERAASKAARLARKARRNGDHQAAAEFAAKAAAAAALWASEAERAAPKAAPKAARLARKAMPSNAPLTEEAKLPNSRAKTSLVLSLVNVFIPCFWVLPVPALLGVIFGFVGRNKVNSGLRENGKGMATAGIILGIAALVGSVAFSVLDGPDAVRRWDCSTLGWADATTCINVNR